MIDDALECKAVENLREQTSTEQETANADLLRGRLRILRPMESRRPLTPVTRPPRTMTPCSWSRSYTASQTRPPPITTVPDAASYVTWENLSR